jgi:hypothetical protein
MTIVVMWLRECYLVDEVVKIRSGFSWLAGASRFHRFSRHTSIALQCVAVQDTFGSKTPDTIVADAVLP